jgi:hypothetical protein
LFEQVRNEIVFLSVLNIKFKGSREVVHYGLEEEFNQSGKSCFDSLQSQLEWFGSERAWKRGKVIIINELKMIWTEENWIFCWVYKAKRQEKLVAFVILAGETYFCLIDKKK